MLETDHLSMQHNREPEDNRTYGALPAGSPVDEIAALISRQLGVYLSASQAAVAEKLGLSLTELKAIELVQEFEALPTGQLGQLMGISWGGTTALINRLEAAGYVQRGRHPLDRRIIVIKPVPERGAELERERQAQADELAFIARQFDAQQLLAVQAFLKQYVRSLRHDTSAWLRTRHELGLND